MTNKLKLLTGIAVTAAVVVAPMAVSAATAPGTTTINAIIGSTISMTTTGTVNLNVTPVTGGAQTSATDTVTVATNNSAGYNLTLSNADASTTLNKAPDTIAAHSGTYATPTALANNTWGYHVSSLGTFGTGSPESNVASSSVKFAGVPALASPQLIKTTSSTAAADVTTVLYGVRADTSKPNGTYTDTVTYTATTK